MQKLERKYPPHSKKLATWRGYLHTYKTITFSSLCFQIYGFMIMFIFFSTIEIFMEL